MYVDVFREEVCMHIFVLFPVEYTEKSRTILSNVNAMFNLPEVTQETCNVGKNNSLY